MTYVVTESCVKCKYTDCVDVCPVDCFKEGPNFIVIDPDECIDCGVCVPECPVDAIFADTDVDAASNRITKTSHGFTTGDKVTYTDGGGTAVVGLIDGGTYFIIRIDANTIKLATTYAFAVAGTAIAITDGIGTNHKLSFGTMLCRTTFPVITKSSSETIAISWVVSVG